MTAEVWPKKKEEAREHILKMWFLKGHEPNSKMIETT